MTMNYDQFHNGLRVLCNIDYPEFSNAVTDGQSHIPAPLRDDPQECWPRFRDNPWRWFIRAPDCQSEAIWKIVEGRMKR